MTYRTYEIVLRHLSGVNKGVQAEHSAKRYIWKYRNEPITEIVMENIENETTIMVDGGTHQDMVEIHKRFEEAGIHHTYFIEPDLNDCMTAITVVADERVWDRKNYKSYMNFAGATEFNNQGEINRYFALVDKYYFVYLIYLYIKFKFQENYL